MAKEKYVPALLHLFREYGYDGATLSRISKETNLGKASLYHHFPGGKDEMVLTVLETLRSWVQENIFKTLAQPEDALTLLTAMCNRVDEVYESGEKPCMLAILLLGSAREVFHQEIEKILNAWIEAIAQVLIKAGMDTTLAQHRGEDALISIQGSLILAQGLNNNSPFKRVIAALPQVLCQGL